MKYYIEPLDKSHVPLFDDFKAYEDEENDYFNNYLRMNGLLDQKQGIAKTYLYIKENKEKKEILGFYSLRASSLIIDIEDAREGQPAIEIYEFAVRYDHQKKGVGKKLMMDAIARIVGISFEIGVKYIIVAAKEDAVGYYKRYKFAEIPFYKKIISTVDNSGCVGMYLPLNVESSNDLFYTDSNIKHLKRGVDALNAGKGTEHELIEVE